MKKALVIFLILILSQSLFSQELVPNFQTASNAGKFIETQGSILKIEYFNDETKYNYNFVISGLLLGAETFIFPGMITDVRSGVKTPFVKVTSTYKDARYESFIDFDEIPACIEALEYILKSETTNSPGNYTHIFFKTRDELEIGAINRFFGSDGTWKTSIAHMKYVKPSYFEISIKKLPKIVEALKESLALLEENMKTE